MATSLCIIFHLGYNSDIIHYLNRFRRLLKWKNCRLFFISSYREDRGDYLLSWMYGVLRVAGRILYCDRGCDTGAFLTALSTIHCTYDYLLKIHTKRSNTRFPQWRDELIHGIFDQSVLDHFKNSEIAIVASKKWILPLDINYECFYDLCRRVPRFCMLGDKMAFIGGTIFWARFSHFSTLMDYSLKELSEMCESGKPSEPSYTHAWERLFTLSQMNRIYGVE